MKNILTERLIIEEIGNTDENDFGIYLKAEPGDFCVNVGTISVYEDGEIGYKLFPLYRGFGYATEALVAICEYLDISGIDYHAIVLPENEKSINVLKRADFILTDTSYHPEYKEHAHTFKPNPERWL